MKLKNKKTGMIGEAGYTSTTDGTIVVNILHEQDKWCDYKSYKSLAELNEEWEDYEEPKAKFDIIPPFAKDDNSVLIEFYSCKGAEKFVEKLEAWKRLKDKGFRFVDYTHMLGEQSSLGRVKFVLDDYEGTSEDLNLLFGGQE